MDINCLNAKYENGYFDIVIVNWNAGPLLAQCVQSIIASPNVDLVGKIIVVDNHSEDDSIQLVPSNDSIQIVLNSSNKGFAAACNQGIALSFSPFCILVNPDTLLHENTLSQCFSFLQGREEIDVLGVRQMGMDGCIKPSCARFPTPLLFLWESIGLSKLFPKVFLPPTLMLDWDHKHSRWVDQVMGSFMVIRRPVFDLIGYFDEQFFVYFEELDFSKRLKSVGGKIFYNADIAITHLGEGTTNSVKGFRMFLFFSSKIYYAKKHFTFLGYGITKWFSLNVEPRIRLFYAFLKKDKNEAHEIRFAARKLKKYLTKADRVKPDDFYFEKYGYNKTQVQLSR